MFFLIVWFAMSPTAEVKVDMLGPTASLEGLTWTNVSPGGEVSMAQSDRPTSLRVRLPGGQTIVEHVPVLSVGSKRGVVTDVTFGLSTPTGEFGEVVQLVCDRIEGWGVGQDDVFSEKLEAIAKRGQGRYDAGFARRKVGEDVNVSVKFYSTGPSRWYASVTLEATSEGRRKIP